MSAVRSPLSRVTPVMLIIVTVILVALVPFLTSWIEFAVAGICCSVLAILGRTGWKFWKRYAKIALPFIIVAFIFNWVSGWVVVWVSAGVFNKGLVSDALLPSAMVGVRFGIGIFFSLLLVCVCTHEELIWGLARLSDRLFRTPVVGEVIALAVLSVPFFAEAFSRIKRLRDIPSAVASVFKESDKIVSHPVKIDARRPGWLLLSVSVAGLIAAIVVK
ncbi:hypothetical protein GF359_07075 [candidate division WOR-3 bacterium]|uniref:Uncharacterized protein n=1 Tax=candidate division WOR-3 bacterium TaxID=2052148 RepID=A0A9D5QDE0_UNCW3|nr:hypothetical protein [candidate division WOR-3 bacterium]MBD3364961.1 hypothetical protein [candidate division WOR-3 bacterium]